MPCAGTSARGSGTSAAGFGVLANRAAAAIAQICIGRDAGHCRSLLAVLVGVGMAVAHADSERPAGRGFYLRAGRIGEILGTVIPADSDDE